MLSSRGVKHTACRAGSSSPQTFALTLPALGAFPSAWARAAVLEPQLYHGNKPGIVCAWLSLLEQAMVLGLFPQCCWGSSATAFTFLAAKHLSKSSGSPSSTLGRSPAPQFVVPILDQLCLVLHVAQVWTSWHAERGGTVH